MKICEIDVKEGYRLIHKFHYLKVFPKLTKVVLAEKESNKLQGVMTLGFGVRPKHTIQKLFPSLDTTDYWEIGRLVLDDKLPRNSESMFISSCMKYIKKNYPNIKLIFTWADGMLGKPGYVYQGSNFLYGGYIWTDCYFYKGERIHPRATNKIGGRPTAEQLLQLGWDHYRGKQFRYVYFLCSHKEKKLLLKESQFEWSTNYPKHSDLAWKKRTEEGWIVSREPHYTSHMNFASTTKIYKWYKNYPTLESYAKEVSREKHLTPS